MEKRVGSNEIVVEKLNGSNEKLNGSHEKLNGSNEKLNGSKVHEKKGETISEGWVAISVIVLTWILARILSPGEIWGRFEEYGEVIPGGLHISVPVIAVILYLLSIVVVPMFPSPSDQSMKWPVTFHNIFLSSLSIVMLFSILKEIWPIYAVHGVEGAVCDSQVLHPKTSLYFWYYIFYLSKMYEFIDTVVLCLKKKKLIFLHVYHHVITLFLVFFCYYDKLSIQWFNASANALVHVFMYYFYACQTLKIDIFWKKYLTSLQILQFILDNIANVYWGYFEIVLGKDCSGSWIGFWFGVSVIASFLILFINFFRKTYTPKGKGAKGENKEL